MLACGSSHDSAPVPYDGDATTARPDADGGYSAGAYDGEIPHWTPPLVLDATATTLELSTLPYPTVTFTLERGGVAEPGTTYTLDRTDLGSIDPSSGVFTPSGAAGVVYVRAASSSGSAQAALFITVRAVDEGDPGRNDLPPGAGGVGGVGGEGGGTPVTDPDLRKALDAPAVKDTALTWLYPYDGTVFPRGLPAPLLMWRSDEVRPLAVRIQIDVDDAFHYDGYFGPPVQAKPGSAVTHLPLPQSVWRAALLSGASMRVSLVVVGRDGSGALVTRRPATNPTWTIAPGSLKGTVYYQSYGTQLAKNFDDGLGGDGRFGGATLAVRGDSFDPKLVAGQTTADNTGCRVCHSVSGDGSVMLVQHEDYQSTSSYDLRNGNAETVRPPADRGKFGWSALSHDGKLALGNAGPPGDYSIIQANGPVSALYDVASGNLLNAVGLNEFVTKAATPAFAIDGSAVAFNLWTGPGSPTIPANGSSLVVMDFAQGPNNTYNFTNPRALYTSKDDTAPAWPSFLPGGAGIVFQRELKPGANSERFMTREGASGELWWVDMDGNALPLGRANGADGLPISAEHPDDSIYQYEPSVAPIVAGGYAWVVFTSRRAYGDVALRPPFQSDPRYYDVSPSSPEGPTTKKLWVFAFDMPPKPGTDPSHPAFYLPSQELFAGNSRGFWVPDACKGAGVGCDSGDECCGGYCRRVTEFGTPVCSDSLPPAACANEYETCRGNTDCCDGGSSLFCVSGRCAQQILR